MSYGMIPGAECGFRQKQSEQNLDAADKEKKLVLYSVREGHYEECAEVPGERI